MNLEHLSALQINRNKFNGIMIEEKNLIGKINLRGKSSDKEFMKSVGSALDLVLPIEPNVKISNNNFKIIWLSPDEWLIEVPESEKDKIISLLESKLNPQKTAITDVTFSKTILRLEGEKVFTLLSKYLVADLDKILKSDYSIAQTIFIKIPVLIVRNNKSKDACSVDLHLNRSHAKYVYELLIDGSKNLSF